MKTKIISLSLMAISLAACNKEDDPKEDKQAPTVTILAPDDTTAYMSGMTMPLKAEISDNDELHEVSLEVTDLTDTVELFHMHVHEDSQNAILDTSIVIPAGPVHRDLEIKFTASDHNGNESEAIRMKHIHM